MANNYVLMCTTKGIAEIGQVESLIMCLIANWMQHNEQEIHNRKLYERDGHIWVVASTMSFAKITGVSESTSRRAIINLIHSGYVIRERLGENGTHSFWFTLTAKALPYIQHRTDISISVSPDDGNQEPTTPVKMTPVKMTGVAKQRKETKEEKKESNIKKEKEDKKETEKKSKKKEKEKSLQFLLLPDTGRKEENENTNSESHEFTRFVAKYNVIANSYGYATIPIDGGLREKINQRFAHILRRVKDVEIYLKNIDTTFSRYMGTTSAGYLTPEYVTRLSNLGFSRTETGHKTPARILDVLMEPDCPITHLPNRPDKHTAATALKKIDRHISALLEHERALYSRGDEKKVARTRKRVNICYQNRSRLLKIISGEKPDQEKFVNSSSRVDRYEERDLGV